MKMACFGVARYNGQFNNQPYDNFEFYFTDVENKNRLSGVVPLTKNVRVSDQRSVKALAVWKVKASEWDNIDHKHQPVDYVNKIVNLLYDSYGNIASVQLLG